MDTEKKVCLGVCLTMILYMLFMYKQMNELKTMVTSNVCIKPAVLSDTLTKEQESSDVIQPNETE